MRRQLGLESVQITQSSTRSLVAEIRDRLPEPDDDRYLGCRLGSARSALLARVVRRENEE